MFEIIVAMTMFAAPIVTSGPTASTGLPAIQPTNASSAPRSTTTQVSARAIARRTCQHVAKTNPVPLYGAWRVSCVDRINVRGLTSDRVTGLGLTDQHRRTIYLKSVANRHAMMRTYAHELSHAWSIDRLTERQRTYFAKRVGKPNFWVGGSYLNRPSEVWAASQARCVGWPTRGYRVVSCSMLLETMLSPR